VLASIGSIGDAYDNALAESFVDSFKTELIADRVWRTRPQLELAIVQYIGWFNHQRLHSALGDIPPAEFEALHAARTGAVHLDGSVAALAPRRSDGLRTRRIPPASTRTAGDGTDRPLPAPSRPLPDAVEFRYAAARH
jgi:Integrase core domain